MGNMFVVGQVGSSGLADIVSFFNTQSSSGDVSGALSSAGIAFKIALFLIMFVGAIAMAIWIGRIAVDILLIVTRGTKIGDNQKLQSIGTGESSSYASVAKYLTGNIVEIALVIVLVAFLMTGWLFRLIAIALAGFGALGNKLFGLDIEGSLSAMDAEAFTENTQARRTASLKVQYDEELASAREEVTMLYEYAKKGAISDDPKFNKSKRLYTTNMAKATVIAATLKTRDTTDLKLGSGYFEQHKRTNGDGVCNTSFVVKDVAEKFDVSISCDGAAN